MMLAPVKNPAPAAGGEGGEGNGRPRRRAEEPAAAKDS
jgi:hypothetical protein